jgi:oligopeptide/dipeptide ABC transporter ATP-binding protein
MPALSVENLRMHYKVSTGYVKAVDGITFHVDKGEVLGIVGESGCGKSSLALALLKLLPSNGEIIGGRIRAGETDVTDMKDSDVRTRIRWKEIAMIPQGAMNSLNPVFKVGNQIGEVFQAHNHIPKRDALERAKSLLTLVGIDPSKANYYPHELSGGMKQRAMIAMALALNPSVLIADEPTTALDVVVQAGIIKLLLALRREYNMAIILISHDLALVAQMSDLIAIMYAGKFAEYGRSLEVYHHPLHPYTIGLLGAFADIRAPKQELVSIPGSPPDLVDPPTGCRFNPRCAYAQEVCKQKEPPFEEASPGHFVACHFWKEVKGLRKGGAGT